MKSVQNPPNLYESEHRELLEPAPEARFEVFEDQSEGILEPGSSRGTFLTFDFLENAELPMAGQARLHWVEPALS